jgi:hypothetical protein
MLVLVWVTVQVLPLVAGGLMVARRRALWSGSRVTVWERLPLAGAAIRLLSWELVSEQPPALALR